MPARVTLQEMELLMVVRAMRADVRKDYIEQGRMLAAEFPQRDGVRLATVEGETVEKTVVRPRTFTFEREALDRVMKWGTSK